MHDLAILATIFDGPDPLTVTADEWATWLAWVDICFPPGWEPEPEAPLTRAERLDEAAWLHPTSVGWDSMGLYEMAAATLAADDGTPAPSTLR